MYGRVSFVLNLARIQKVSVGRQVGDGAVSLLERRDQQWDLSCDSVILAVADNGMYSVSVTLSIWLWRLNVHPHGKHRDFNFRKKDKEGQFLLHAFIFCFAKTGIGETGGDVGREASGWRSSFHSSNLFLVSTHRSSHVHADRHAK